MAVVLSGAGARGAYEAGAMSVILPALGGAQPRLYVGTSAGAINATGLSSLSHLGPEEAGERLVDLWLQTRQGDIFRRPVPTVVRSAARFLAGTRRSRRRSRGVLDTAPLFRSLARVINWDQLHANLGYGPLAGCGVVATSRKGQGTTVFFEGGPRRALPEGDPVRGIRFVPTALTPAHLVASSAVPAVFPAVELGQPGYPPEWYVDGGVLLNTPIKPALMLGADSVVVVSTSPLTAVAADHDAKLPAPGVGGGLVDILRAVLDARASEDLRTLIRRNDRAAAAGDGLPRTINYAFAGPRVPGDLGRLAEEVLKRKGLWPPFAVLARLVSGSADMCEMASFVLYDPEFIAGAVELGRRDALAQLVGGKVDWRPALPSATSSERRPA